MQTCLPLFPKENNQNGAERLTASYNGPASKLNEVGFFIRVNTNV
jgi:hypothetical protein